MKEIPLILIGGGNSSIEIIDLINDINKIEEYLLIKEDFFTKTVSSLTDEQEKNIPVDGWNFI